MADEETLRDYLKWATTNLYDARQRLRDLEDREREPIAIVGMGCRFPGGVSSPADFWELLSGAVDAVTGFPQDRGWDNDSIYDSDPDRPGTTYVRQGAFLHDAAEFDPGFFGISPREALAMDPQQRLLLEVSWEALERAGIDPRSLHGTATGVFAGAYASGYGLDLHMTGTGTSEQEAGLTTGGATAVISGRVSYTLGLEGPAVTVDTACSSSLVALHLASQALRSGECSLALAGGVTVMGVPWELIAMGKTRVLAADGRCKAFGASADGMGLAEGAAMLVIERLSDARRNGHPVLAVIRASAVNQDGASNGLAAPNGGSQQRVIRTALASAGLAPSDVDAVEAHGTGTKLGDPIEAHALLATYGQDRPEGEPLWLGSVKSNIGHTQCAAGVAGVIKMVLAIQHQELPRTLHAGTPSTEIDWSAGDVRLLTEPVPWTTNGRPRRAGVSSFGVSGTNAHLILEEPTAEPAEAAAEDPVVPGEELAPDSAEAAPLAVLASSPNAWLVSGRSIAGLRAQAARLAEWTADDLGGGPADIAWSLVTTRATFEHRAVVIGRETADLTAGLSALAAGQAARPVITGTAAATGAGRVVFVFPGQGAQWTGMGTELARSSPVFAARLAECAAALAPYVDWSLDDVLAGAPGAPSLDRADVAQPALWAVMVSLAAVWQAAGVTPQAVTGHSQGEIAAATVAGMLSLDDAARVVAVRSRALSALRVPGGLLSVMMPVKAVRPLLAPWAGRIGVAAVNSPAATVVSGEPDALAELEAELAKRHIMRWPVPRSDFVAHSAAVDELAPVLAAELAEITPAAGQLPLYSTVTCEWADGAGLDGGYWFANVRQEVRFAEAIGGLAAAGFRTFIEVSPHAVLTSSIDETLQAEGTAGVVTGTLDRQDGGAGRLLAALAVVHVRGQHVDWAAVLPRAGGRVRPLDLPTTAFQHDHYWMHAPQVAEPEAAGPAEEQAATPAERRFWAAVESGDAPGLAAALAIEDTQRLADLIPVLADWRRRERRDSATTSWRYRIGWTPAPDPGPAALPGNWLVVAGRSEQEQELAARCARALAARGAQPVLVPVGQAGEIRDALAARIGQALTGQAPLPASGEPTAPDAVPPLPPVAGVLSLLALDEAPLPGRPAVPSGLVNTLTLLQALGDAGIEAPLWTLTCGAVAAVPGEGLARPVQAHVWGLARVVEHEHPARWGGLVDLPGQDGRPVLDERTAARLCAVLAGCGEDQVAIRPAGLLARRLTRAGQAATGQSKAARPWVPSGTALVTGGTGAIGGHVARWLAGLAAPRVILTSRSGPAAASVPALAAQLAHAGTTVQVTACDVGDRGQLSALIDRIATDGPPLTAVFHTAVALDDGVLDRLDAARMATVLAPKAAGADYLDELTVGLGLDAFVLFSSIAGTFGGGGQASYSAANAFLDALAGSRRSRGLPGLSVAWGPWAGEGIGQSSDATRQKLARNHWEKQMDPGLAVQVLARALAGDESLLVVLDVNWDELAAMPGAADMSTASLLRDLPEAQPRQLTHQAGADHSAGSAAGAGQNTLAGQLAPLSRSERTRLLTDLIKTKAAIVLGYPSPEAVEASRAFSDLGFDSLTAVELRNQLSTAAGLALPATVLYDYPTPDSLAEHLRVELGEEADTERIVVSSAATTAADEAIAIVAMSCRLPGGLRGPDELWDLLAAGGDAIAGFPQDRGWDLSDLYDTDPSRPGTSYVREGGFVHHAGEFDAAFFGISPREALAMDPQQRLLLELSWEALERAGIAAGTLRGTRTGVFAGGYGSGYAIGLQLAPEGPGDLEGHLLTGNSGSVLSGRLAYVLGLEGPTLTVDTACSSSLVALHLAGQALRAGECDLALVAGVTIMATPWELIGMSRQQGLAADGRCKSFGAGADGMGMAEGAAVLVVERLSDAVRDGHDVLAVVTGSAVNSDGASNGLTAPNGPSQQRVIRAALASARLSPCDVDAVEAHGTGTPLGDPIEAQAIIAAYGQDRPEDRPLRLGSVKSNIGHTQAAAGVTGVIKMILALQHEELPRTLHSDEPSPHIDWTAGDVRLLHESLPWPANSERKRRAGVSAFGVSGTNAHVIIEEAPAAAARAEDPAPGSAVLGPRTGVTAWPVSARSAPALAAQALRLADWVSARPDLDPAGVAWSLAATRTAFEHRAVVTGTSRDELTAGLAAVAAGRPSPAAVTGSAVGAPGKTVFVFPGQGSQWTGMGTELAAESPVFAARLAECSAALAPYASWKLEDVLAGSGGAADLERVEVVQPALWAVMVSLAAAWQAAGVRPDAVAGHSQGEIAAAVVAGVLSLDDAAKVVALRSRALTALAGRGAMASLALSADAVRDRLAAWPGLSVAAVNGPGATVVSGDPDAVAALVAGCEAEGIRARVLRVDYASHGPQVAELEREILAVLDGIEPRPASIPMISAMTGEYLKGPEADAGYWYASLRAPVEFDRSVRSLAQTGHRTFIEVSPHPVLTAAIDETLDGAVPDFAVEPTVVGTLRRDDGGPARLLTSLAEAAARGVGVDWTAVLPPARCTGLPTYAFEHKHYWAQSLVSLKALRAASAGEPPAAAPTDRDGTDRDGTDRDGTGRLRYQISWTPVPGGQTNGQDAAAMTGNWLVVAPAGRPGASLAAACARALAAHGASAVMLEAGSETADRAVMAAAINGALLTEAAPDTGAEPGTGAASLAGVLSLLALDTEPVSGYPAVPAGLAGTTALVQALGDLDIAAPLWAVTQGAVATAPGETLTSPVQAQVWGLGRVAGLEHPDRWGGLIDLPAVRDGQPVPAEPSRPDGQSVLDEQTGAQLCAVLAGCGEDQVALRGADILARRLVRAPVPGRAPGTGPGTDDWAPRGTTLVTGGTGAIGRHVARWLTERGAPRTVLASRSGPAAAGAAALAAGLAESGTAVEMLAADCGSRADLAGLLAGIAVDHANGDGPPLTAVFHTAGLGQGTELRETTLAETAAMTGAKAAGAAHLHELTEGLDLDAFVLFSSIAATWGSGLQPGYAAANAFLDALATYRRGRGLPATSVAWGAWGGGGMTDADSAAQLERRGLLRMDPAHAIRALAQAVAGGDVQVTVADVDWVRFVPPFTLRRPSPLIGALPDVRQVLDAAESESVADGIPAAEAGLAGRLAGLARAEQERVLVNLVRAEAAAALGHDSADEIEAVRAFRDLGFDSLTAVELRNRLRTASGLRLPATVVFDYPTSVELAGYLRTELSPDGPAIDPVFTQLDQLESILSGIPGGSAIRADVTDRLRTVLSKWVSGADVKQQNAAAQKLESATADEVFDFINKELGVS
jgi:acyl transferase domain-containing protein/acyl carrier protein